MDTRHRRSTPAELRVLTVDGLEFLTGLSPDEASAVGHHWNAIRRYLETGDMYPLYQMHGAIVDGKELETRIEVIEWQAMRGDVSFESIYEEVI